MKFVHRFSRSVSWEIMARDEPPAKGESHIQEVDWSRSAEAET
jgi:hypothetical protein